MSKQRLCIQVVPRACVIGGKAAPGYERAKKIIKMVSAVSSKVNADPDVGDLLKVVFVPDYNVSLAEILIPGEQLQPQAQVYVLQHCAIDSNAELCLRCIWLTMPLPCVARAALTPQLSGNVTCSFVI